MTAPLFIKTLVREEHVRSFQVHPVPAVGWEVSEREDQRVLQHRQYSDWHRVERTLSRFTRAVAELRRQGWHEA
jgi:hypothetical protein